MRFDSHFELRELASNVGATLEGAQQTLQQLAYGSAFDEDYKIWGENGFPELHKEKLQEIAALARQIDIELDEFKRGE